MEKKHIYLISGLGSDERVFQYLDLKDYEVHPVQWIDPVKGESMQDYAQRLKAQIKTADPILIGLSMGGMIAVEIGKLISTEKIILISSAKFASELPTSFNIFKKWKAHHYIPDFLLLWPNRVLYHMFSVYNRRDKAMLKSILQDTDAKFARWAMDAILKWKNSEIKGTLIHIHGIRDRIIPIENVAADYIIEGGSHSMVFQQPEKITGIIRQIISQ